MDSVWEQRKLEATLREMLAVGAADWASELQANTVRPAAHPVEHSKTRTGCIIQVIVRDALLAGFLFCSTLLAVNHSANIRQLPVVIAPARS